MKRNYSKGKNMNFHPKLKHSLISFSISDIYQQFRSPTYSMSVGQYSEAFNLLCTVVAKYPVNPTCQLFWALCKTWIKLEGGLVLKFLFSLLHIILVFDNQHLSLFKCSNAVLMNTPENEYALIEYSMCIRQWVKTDKRLHICMLK